MLLGVGLLWASLLLHTALADLHSQFDYKGHHANAAALANGHASKQERPHEEPRIREKFAQDETIRWAQYIPHTSKSIAEEMAEARRHARQEESKKLQMERDEQEQKERQEAEEARVAKVESDKRRGKSRNKKQSVVDKAAQKVKTATKKTRQKVRAKAERWLDLDDDDDEDDDDDDHRSRTRSNAIGSRIWSSFKWVLGACYLSLAWSGRHLLYIPLKYAVHGLRWSANTSWRTTMWTGERAFVGPALTVGAPVIYLGEGFLFIFVWTPARIASFIAREFYPIYIFLGAALVVGTSMGIASAIILYIGSFFLSDSSKLEGRVSQRVEAFPEDLQKRFKVKSSAAKKWAKTGGSVIERAIQESLEKQSRGVQEVAEESEEDEDYFGSNETSASFKGKERSVSDLSPIVTSARRTPTHFGPPLPVGATGWNHSRSDSSASSPATSPATHRSFLPNGASPSYAPASSKLTASPIVSPDVFRSRSSRQRRNVSASL